MHQQVNKSQYTDNMGSEHTVLQQLMMVQSAVVLMLLEKRGSPGSAGVTSSVLKNAEHGSYGVITYRGHLQESHCAQHHGRPEPQLEKTIPLVEDRDTFCLSAFENEAS